MRYQHRRYIALSIVLVIIGVIWFVPFKTQFNIRTSSWVQPLKKWSLRTDLEGNFYSELENFETGAKELATSYRFERGDIATLKLAGGMANNTFINSGDTLGMLHSRIVDERIVQLENLMAVEKQLLNSSLAGEKLEILESLKKKLQLAEQQYDFAYKNYERFESLYKDKAVTASEFEIAETAFNTANTNIEIAKSEYESAVTGVKPEEIRLIKEQIQAYDIEINFLEDTKKRFLLTAPISGNLMFNHYLPEQMEYISLSDTSAYILYIPVKVRYRPYLKKNMLVSLKVPGSNQALQAEVYDISDKVENLVTNMVVHQVVFVKAHIISQSPLLCAGVSLQSTLKGDRVTLREYISRTVDIFFR